MWFLKKCDRNTIINILGTFDEHFFSMSLTLEVEDEVNYSSKSFFPEK